MQPDARSAIIMRHERDGEPAHRSRLNPDDRRDAFEMFGTLASPTQPAGITNRTTPE